MSYKTYSDIYNINTPPADQYSKDPKEWGPHLWKYLHTCAANYSETPDFDTINNMMVWLKSLFVTIPCVHCKEHYKMYIENNDQNLYLICSSRSNLFRFIVDLHNWVNRKNGKREWSYEEANMMYR